ncbi:uncharacterized protein [Aegilops tauschii subsp. strangulata]|uniref:uncharacterized protein n=1 Tax=Aegilops tauschii subsp. strangulata TaxID=200361 RepID=UPI003CC86B85
MACWHTLQIHLLPWGRVFMDELDRRLQALLQFRALAPAAAVPHLPWLPHHCAISSRRGSAAGATCPGRDHLTCQAPNRNPWYPPRLVLLVLVWMCTKFNYQSTPSSGYRDIE